MGREAKVQAQFDGLFELGRLHWEAPELIFKGATRKEWAGAALKGVTSEGDDLVLADGARFTFNEGYQAARWAEVIDKPPNRLDKLGVKRGQRIGAVWIEDEAFLDELAERAPLAEEEDDLDLLFAAIDSLDDLDVIPDMMERVKPKGALWIVSRKGKAATIKDVDVIAAARSYGLVDSKVCAFSPTHTALRFTRRKGGPAPKPAPEAEEEEGWE
ncbi:MAG: hypothetical protein BGN86_10920 [Caulobacterales bacterium 68-7]|nr:DUF3052 family protein [Caulobacterales bacterium]OJU11620.1 MAG: hypothetical protein BGN86_10920 [Caulobacterales bacterium 68-7]